MGEGGQIGLINGTKHIWRRTAQSQYQMNAWDFPNEILPGTVSTVYVEFKQDWLTHRSDTQASCTYVLDGTDCKFHVSIRDAPSNIKVRLENVETPNNPNGRDLELGWQHDGIRYFVLSGTAGNFSSSNPPVDWMQQNLPTLGSKALAQLCLPGTHDAGMGEITWSDNIPKPIISIFTQTQSRDILGQLYHGSRYFDIRPEISMGGTWTGHYQGKLGARGQSIASIINNVNAFTAQHKELIILNFSHATNTDDNFRDYNQDEWNSLMTQLLQLNDRFIHADPNDLSLLTLSTFIGSNPPRAAVLCIIEAPPTITITQPNSGFYLPRHLNVRNEYSNTSDPVRMSTDQLRKLTTHAVGGDKRLFLLSWTLTQQTPDFANFNDLLAQLARFKSVRDMAYSANKSLFLELFPQTARTAFPNVLYVDFMESSDFVALAMAINCKWLD